jgi:SAM-dependent methyltransferase
VKRHAPSALRNREPILDVLREVLPVGLVLEIASGSGQHAIHFARALPDRVFQPSDPDPDARASVDAYVAEAGLDNLLGSVDIDAKSDAWPVERADAVLSINMIHIAPYAACEGLGRGAARVLPPGGPLVLYGPFRFDGELPAPSNVEFDASLRTQNPEWGIRNVADVARTFESYRLRRDRVVEMPANNHIVVFRRT